MGFFDIFSPVKLVKAVIDVGRMVGGAKPIHTNLGKAIGNMGGRVWLPIVGGAAAGYTLGSWLAGAGTASGSAAGTASAGTASAGTAAGTTSSLFSPSVIGAILGGKALGGYAMNKMQLERLETVQQQLNSEQQKELQDALSRQKTYESMLAQIEQSGKPPKHEHTQEMMEKERQEKHIKRYSLPSSMFYITPENFMLYPSLKKLKRQYNGIENILARLKV